MRLSRRSFLKRSSASAAALSMSGSMVALSSQKVAAAPSSLNKWPGRVVVNFNKAAVSGTTVNETVSKKMVDDAIMLLTGQTSVGAAWKAIFPASLSATSKVAIKTNILNNGLPCPHASTVQAITEGLLQMDLGGAKIPAANITIFDGNNENTMDSAGYTATRFPNIKRVKDTYQAFGDGALNNRPYALTLNSHDFLINVFSPRGHGTGSTFTLGFKSHFGTYNNASGLHTNAKTNLRDMTCVGPVYNKLVLSMCSGLFGMNEGNGPRGSAEPYTIYARTMDASIASTATVNPTTIIMSTDPVSCEMQAIKTMRLNKNPAGGYAVADMPDYLKTSAGVAVTGMTPVYNIGEIDETKMDVRKIINGQIVTTASLDQPFRNAGTMKMGDLTITRTPGGFFAEFMTTEGQVGRTAEILISNLEGKVVWSSSLAIPGVRNHFTWSGQTLSGQSVPSGIYSLQVRSGRMRMISKFTIS